MAETYSLPFTGDQIKAEIQQLINNEFTNIMKSLSPSSSSDTNDIATTQWVADYVDSHGGGGGGSSVNWEQLVTSGTQIATITIDGNDTDVYAPTGGGGGGAVSGVKGNAESTYRTGNVNLTAANIGAYVKPSSGIPSSDMSSAVQASLAKADSAIQSHQSLTNYLQKSGGALTGQLTAASSAVSSISTSQIRNIKASTTDLTAGTSTLASGDIYLVYE